MLVPKIHKGVVTMAAVHIDKVKDTHLITFLFEQTANVTDDFALWVKHHERGVALHSVGLAKKPCLTCTRTAADQNIQVPAVLLSVQADTHILPTTSIGPALTASGAPPILST